ncbi:MAG: ribosome-associated protein [Alteromonadaceae bacterium]|jgi:ribosome-associated protein
MSEQFPIIEISSQPIELCKLLKLANMVSGGGEAKIVISEGYILVNGEVESQKRKKIYDKDIIEFNGDIVKVSYCPAVKNKQQTTDNKVKIKPVTAKNIKAVDQPNTIVPVIQSNKRKPISF